MCGIVGFNWKDKSLLDEMLSSMRHRGPDMSGTYTNNNFSIGHDRLSILDLSDNAKQPMKNEAGDIVMSFNGEIYNFKEIKSKLKQKHIFKSKSDTEVILHLYEEVGDKFVEYLNGDFAIAIYDIKKNKIILTRDRFGIKPLYYYIRKDKLMFFSELKAILKWNRFNPKVKKESLSNYLVYSFVPDPDTILEDVYKVSPSEIISIDLDNLEIEKNKYYHVNTKKSNISFPEAKHKFLDKLKSAVERRMVSDVPVGAYLSGGLDSSSVVALMDKTKKSKIETFSVDFDSTDVQNESKYSTMVSSCLNTNHNRLSLKEDSINQFSKIIWHLDEPISNITAIPLYFLSQEAKKKVTVVLNGNGADECLGGYRHYKVLNFINDHPKMIGLIPIKTIERLFSGTKYKNYISQIKNIILNREDKESLHKAFLYKNFSDAERLKIFKDYKIKNPLNKFFNNDETYINQMQHIDLQNLLSSNLLMMDDKMAMAHSIESRVPFLDHELVDFVNSLPDEYKINKWTGKYILRESMKDILPLEISQRKKYGFTAPLKKWFNFFKQDIYIKLTASEFFDKEEILKRFNDLTNQSINQLWQMYVFEKWYEVFILNKGEYPL